MVDLSLSMIQNTNLKQFFKNACRKKHYLYGFPVFTPEYWDAVRVLGASRN